MITRNINISISQRKVIDRLFIVLLLNSVIESFLAYFDDRFSIIVAQVLLNGAYLAHTFISYKKVRKPQHVQIVIFLVLFLLLCSFFSSDLIRSLNFLLKFSIPYFFYVVGFNVLSSKEHVKYFVGKLWMFMAYFTLYTIIVNILNLGSPIYTGGLIMGFYSINGLYIPTFSIIVFVYFYKYIPRGKQRVLGLIFSITTVFILLLLLKRTLILLILLGAVLFIIKSVSIKKLVQVSLVLGALIVIGFLFQDQLADSFESRSNRFNKEYEIGNEGRFIEISYIYNYMTENPLRLLLGTGEVFNDRDTVSRFFGGVREAHNSYVRIFWSGGLVGLTLFLVFYYRQFKVTFSAFRFLKNNTDSVLKSFFYFTMVFILLRFINDFSSGITYLGYNAFSLAIIGGMMRLTGTLNGKELTGSKKNTAIIGEGESFISTSI